MKNYAKVGGKKGKPAYRTPAWRQGRPAIFIKKSMKLRRPPRLEGKVQRKGIKPIRKKPKGFGLIGILITVAIIIVITVGGFYTFRKANDTITGPEGFKDIIEQAEEAKRKIEERNMVVKEFSMTAKKFVFEPGTITVDKGDKVILHITSIDVTHGFSLREFRVNVFLPPNETKTVEFVADKTGTYIFSCSVLCGSGHSEMTGKLIVR